MAGIDDDIRIAVDARPFAGPPCGYTVYLSSVIACLRAPDIRLTLLSDAPLLPRYGDLAGLDVRVAGEASGLRWEQFSLPELLLQDRYDVYFVGANRGIPVRKRPGTHYVLGLLDIIPYLFWRQYLWRPLRDRDSRAWLIREIASQLLSLARADSVLTISHQSARDIERVFHRTATALPIRLSPPPAMVPTQTRPHFAYVGGVDHRKRVDVLVRAFALFLEQRPGHRLFLIGANYAPVQPLIRELGLEDSVAITGFVDEETKYRLLSESMALVYPSLYEGYGLAIAEAFQAGTAVIAGAGGSQAEVGGDAVRLIDPTSPQDVAAAMAEMLVSAERDRRVALGRDQLRRLSDPVIERDTQAFFREKARAARAAWVT